MGSNPIPSANWDFASLTTELRGGKAAARQRFEGARSAKTKTFYQSVKGKRNFLTAEIFMIRGMILDIDGVIIGEKIGVNSPNPHPAVIGALKSIRAKGVSISLCTAKPYFAILNIIEDANLNNPHITEGGSVIINPIDKVIVQKYVIDSGIASKIIDSYLKNDVYTEFYTTDNYFIQKNQYSDITEKHNHILQKKPTTVESLSKEALSSEIVKIMPIARDEADKDRLANIFKPFEEQLTLSWGVHPIALPLQFGIITARGISKERGAQELAKNLSISFEEMLGVGDSTSDWQFIKLCSYAAAMGNASEELKKLVLSKGEKFSYIGPTVDENGILEIFKHFQLLP